MTLLDVHIATLGILVAVTCVLPGTFLLLRGVALMSDAISHAILPGIVIMFLYTQNLHSPLLMFGAALAGLLTVVLTEGIIASKRLQKDAAIGLVFPLFFSVGILLISLYARTVHLDIDMVIMGELLFAPFNTFNIAGYNFGPTALWVMSGLLLLNATFVSLCYKELKLTTLSPTYAAVIGFYPSYIHYTLMCLTSLTCVGAFDIVGAIVVVSLMITPPATAYLLVHTLDRMLYVSIGIAILSVLLGYTIAYQWDVSIAGSLATGNGILFIGALLYCLSKKVKYRWKKQGHRMNNLRKI